jgi:CheY-like chemotaxis protein
MKQIFKKKVSTCFPIWLPSLCRPSKTSAVIPSILPKFSDARILIIEDERSALKMLSRNISKIAGNEKEAHGAWESAHIHSRDTGEAALKMFTSADRPFDILFIDNTLKGKLMGFEVAVQLRERGYNGPIVMVTSAEPEELGGLKLTEVIKDESGLELRTVKPDRYGSTITERTHEAYLLPKTANNASSLERIIKAHFIMPDPKPEAQKIPPTTVPPNIRFLDSLKRSAAHDLALKELLQHQKDHLSTIIRDLGPLIGKEDSSSTLPTVTFGKVSTEAPDQHIYASAITQLQFTALNPNGDAGWATKCLAIATQALTLIQQNKILASLAFIINQLHSKFFG